MYQYYLIKRIIGILLHRTMSIFKYVFLNYTTYINCSDGFLFNVHLTKIGSRLLFEMLEHLNLENLKI